MTNGVHKYGE